MSNGWPLVPMEEIFEIARGGSPRPIDSFLTDDPDGVNWVMISDATESGKYINSTKKRIREEGVKRSRVVQPGDFLLTNSMSFGRPYIMNTSGCIHDGWLVLSPRHQNVSPDFFYHLLGSDFVYAEFVRRAAGATVKNLNIDLVKGVRVPLPPLEEQRRIANVLDRAEALQVKRRAAIAQLDILTQFIFLDLFGDPATNPKGWVMGALGANFDLKNGINFSADQKGRGILTVDVLNMYSDDIYVRATDLYRVDVSISEERLLVPGDLLFVRSSVKQEGVAWPAIFFGHSEPVTYCGFLIRARSIIDRGLFDSRFLVHYLRQPSVRQQLVARAGKVAITNINQERLSSLLIPVPPLPLQRDFSRRIAAVENLKIAHRSALSELEALFASLRHRAFRGEL